MILENHKSNYKKISEDELNKIIGGQIQTKLVHGYSIFRHALSKKFHKW
ncbi:bacteriocin [Limosilactobacillus gastricus]|nr:bacteriocin [Limosilactobacillus gastricus]